MTVHAEAVRHLHATVAAIQEAAVRAGVALNPATPLAQSRRSSIGWTCC